MDIEHELIRADERVFEAKRLLWGAVLLARQEGWTWSEIADLFGVSRQAVQERFTKAPTRSEAKGRQAVHPGQGTLA